MPKRKSIWSSWNYIVNPENTQNLSITYWMNRLQSLNTNQDIFVTLNPIQIPDINKTIKARNYYYSNKYEPISALIAI